MSLKQCCYNSNKLLIALVTVSYVSCVVIFEKTARMLAKELVFRFIHIQFYDLMRNTFKPHLQLRGILESTLSMHHVLIQPFYDSFAKDIGQCIIEKQTKRQIFKCKIFSSLNYIQISITQITHNMKSWITRICIDQGLLEKTCLNQTKLAQITQNNLVTKLYLCKSDFRIITP